MNQLWIAPELEARRKAGKLPPDFQIRRCLIRLPRSAKPIVEFNEEVTLTARVKVPDGREVNSGGIAYLEDCRARRSTGSGRGSPDLKALRVTRS